MTGRLTYRLYQDADLPGLLRLWEGTKLGALSPELWRQRYVDAPHGPSLISVAVDENGRHTTALEGVTDEVLDPSVGNRHHRRPASDAVDRI